MIVKDQPYGAAACEFNGHRSRVRLINNNQWSACAPAATGARADDDERARADDDTGPTHLPRGKGSELLFAENGKGRSGRRQRARFAK